MRNTLYFILALIDCVLGFMNAAIGHFTLAVILLIAAFLLSLGIKENK